MPSGESTSSYVGNLNADPRLLGFEMLLCPFPLHNSSPRGDMFASHLTQAQVLKGGEQPFIYTGYESLVGEYEFDETARTQDAEIIAVIPKYRTVTGIHQIRENPSLLVIYLGLEDKKLHYFELRRYTKGSDGYGYYNIPLNNHLLQPGTLLDKDTKLMTSPIHRGEEYGLGVNANIAYITMPETVEDAFVISQSLADRMSSRSIETMTIRISPNQHPLNLYGDKTEIKFLPDIGERVNDDGILCGFRTPTEATFASDTLDIELHKPHHLHDKLYKAPPGATILDIDFYVNKCKVPQHLYTQVEKYVDATKVFYKRIYDVYKEWGPKYQSSNEFNTLVSKAISRLIASGEKIKGVPYKPNTKLISKDTMIEYLQIDITYTHEIKVEKGFKVTGRDGAKGVISAIKPDDEMPVDDYGNRADICVDPTSPLARMNMGQLYEQHLNLVSESVRRNIRNGVANPFEYLMEYFGMINPNYEQLVRQNCATPTDQEILIKDVLNRGIYLNIPPGLDTITPQLVKDLTAKYDIKLTPVTFVQTDSAGNKRTIRTKDPVCIGSKYMYLLYKMPEVAASGIGFVNQLMTPIRPSTGARKRYAISQTPLRFGEDEFRLFTACLPDTSRAMRMMCLQGNSPKGVNMLTEAMLTEPKPTRIGHIDISNEELIESNLIVATVHHIFSCCGIDSLNTRVRPLSKGDRQKYLEDK